MKREYEEFPSSLEVPSMTPNELSRILDFVEQMEDETDAALDLRGSNRELRILVHLMRNHIAGRLSTQTSLADSSGLAYGTALRAIHDLVDRGMMMKRPRTKSGKSFSLHPSPKLIQQWKVFARRVKGIVGGVFGWSSQRRVVDDYYFGASYMCANVIRPPSALDKSLRINKLRLLNHADPTFLAMTSLKSQFETVLGVELSTKSVSIDRLYREIEDNSNLSRSKYDLIACNLPWLGALASRGLILPLQDILAEDQFDLSDFHPETVECARWNGVQYGIPMQTAAELLLYRRDLFEQAGLTAPTTSDELLHAARTLHNPHRGMSGIAWNAARGTPLGHTFSMIMAAFGQPIINLRSDGETYFCANVTGEEYRPMFLSELAFDVADFLIELIEFSPPNIFGMSWYERAKCYAKGECAMAYCYSLLASLILNDGQSPAQKVTGFLPHPAGPKGQPIAPVGGYAVAIPSNIETERIPDAWKALRILTSAEAVKQFIMSGSTSSPRMSVGRDPEVFSICPLVSQVDQMVRQGLVQYWPRPPIPELQEIVSVLGQEIFPMLHRQTSVKDALTTVQNRCDALMRANGHY